ncbi:hypothetical protein ACO1PK_06435 [Alishewanella sp. d11]|uniref:hypothetical protein n=1 Tax=Alishewanella sp. d11 TaxID=3414030 RepID=UPI003BF84A09
MNLAAQLQQLSALLQPFPFGIGGSCLLWQLGLEAQPGDIDVVCREEDFDTICRLLAQHYQPEAVTLHADFVTRHFARFSQSGARDIELMAGIAVLQQGQLIEWTFHPERCFWQDNMCFMPASDWLELYGLFNRPKRVETLKRYLAE